MSNEILRSLLYLVLLVIPLLYLQRSLQREIQSIFLLITRHPEISMALFSLLFFPGVLLHELSHYLVARLLGVRTGRFSIIPKKMANGRMQLGYVETATTDFFRDAIIGAAPLILGILIIALIGVYRLELSPLWDSIVSGQASLVRAALNTVINQPDFWLWFYLIFTISSTMMPSSSDRRAWLPLILVFILFFGIILLVGAGPWLYTRFAATFNSGMKVLMIVFSTTVIIHTILLIPSWGIRKILSRITGYQVV